MVIKTTGSKHWVEAAGTGICECIIRGKLRTREIKSTNPVAVGDWVDFERDENKNLGIIHDIFDRKNYIVRKSVNLSKQSHVLAANIDLAVIIATMAQPETSTEFIDRFLVTAEAYRIKPAIIFNKIDIYGDSEHEKLKWYHNIYTGIGYECYDTSAAELMNIESIKTLFQNKITLLTGHSGVGKSTLINVIEPALNLKTTKISEYHKSGKHTTTFTEMFKLSFGGYIIDTPGIKAFGTFDMKKEEVSHYFPEFFRLSSCCQYYNCTHIHEPNCAVLQALDKNEISWTRYKSYLSITGGNDDKYRLPE